MMHEARGYLQFDCKVDDPCLVRKLPGYAIVAVGAGARRAAQQVPALPVQHAAAARQS